MKPRYIFLDYGGTLTIEQRSSFIAPTEELCAKIAGMLSAEIREPNGELERLLGDGRAFRERLGRWLSAERMRRNASDTEVDSGRMWRDILNLCDHQLAGGFAAAAEEAAVLIETDGDPRALRPEVPEALRLLGAAGVGLGIVSNVITRARVPWELERFGVSHFFDPVVLSSEFGYRKPDPAIFHRALVLAGMPARECWYVGDTRSRDMLGAHRAGFGRAIAIGDAADAVSPKLSRGFPPDFLEPDARVNTLAELYALVMDEQDDRAAGLGSPPGRSPSAAVAAECSVQAVLFDASGVLYYRPEGNGELDRYLSRLKSLGCLDGAPSEAVGPSVEELERRSFTGAVPREVYQRAALRRLGVPDDDALLAEGVAALQADSRVAAYFPGVAETLQELRARGFLLGVVSNTSLSLHDKLALFEAGGFGHVWDAVVLSIDCGAAKPDAAIYTYAADQLGVAPQQGIFVGHEASELLGARNAMLRTVSFNCAPELPADLHIASFPGLLRAVEELATLGKAEDPTAN